MNLSPMMQQYQEAKSASGDAILLFRMGDFYELFHDDAKTAARVLGLTLTSRDKGENPVPMAGFPHHQLESYLGKLIRSGHRVAVCDQVEDAALAKGLVKREVTRVVTAGTVIEDELLTPDAPNYLAAVHVDGDCAAISARSSVARVQTGSLRCPQSWSRRSQRRDHRPDRLGLRASPGLVGSDRGRHGRHAQLQL